MAAAEDRQAKALEGIERSLWQLVRINEILNTGLVQTIKTFENFTALLQTVEAEVADKEDNNESTGRE